MRRGERRAVLGVVKAKMLSDDSVKRRIERKRCSMEKIYILFNIFYVNSG